MESGACAESCPLGKVDGRWVVSSYKTEELNTVGEVPDSLCCPVCTTAALDGVLTCNGRHLFHKSCIDRAMRNNGRTCPTCRNKIDAYHNIPDVPGAWKLRQDLETLRVSCPLGCSEVVQFELLHHHVREECACTTLWCKHDGCDVQLRRSNIEEHEAVCGMAAVTCDCGRMLRRQELNAHRSFDCPSYPIACEICGLEGIPRKSIEAHFDKCDGPVPMKLFNGVLKRMRAMERQLFKEEAFTCKEGSGIELPENVNIVTDHYGVADDDARRLDLTAATHSMYRQGVRKFEATNSECGGDPAFGVTKQRKITVTRLDCPSGP